MLMRSKYPSNNESGFVTVLMVLLIGMAIAASAVGTAYYINSSQKGLVSGHALTNAKSGAWTGVETFRQYLESLSEAQIKALNGQTGITLTAGTRSLKVQNLSVVEPVSTSDPTYRVTAEIQNTSAAAKSSATVQIVYDVTLATSPSTNPVPDKTITFAGGMNFYGNLNAHGNINFANSNGDTVLNVAGDFSNTSGADGLAIVNVGGSADINTNKYREAGTQVFEGLNSLPDRPIVNALDFEAMANYVFYVDGSGNRKVDVKNVSGNGISDGTYALTDVGGFNGVISYSDGSDKWTLDGGTNSSSISIAPGILLFKGSVELKKGTFANTILATENIDYAGNKNNLTLNAPNRAGAAVVCNSAFAMPTNLCNEDRTLRANAIGDIALLAGSCADPTSVASCSRDYDGGTISTAASSEVTGNIVAGNKLDAGGRSMLRGAVLAAALSNNPIERGSDVGGNFTIDSSNSGGTTITIPGTGGGTGGGTTTTQTSQIKWARYI